jgi:hypothetical protein
MERNGTTFYLYTIVYKIQSIMALLPFPPLEFALPSVLFYSYEYNLTCYIYMFSHYKYVCSIIIFIVVEG